MMRAFYFTLAMVAGSVPSMVLAQTPQVAPVRVEFTRPGGTPGNPRAIVRPSEVYMIAPAQPDGVAVQKRRKQR